MVTRTRNPNRTRRAILDAAAAEVCAVGRAGARIDAIAEAAGVNKRMLYHYFASKDGLFAAVLDDRLAADPVAASAGTLVDLHVAASGDADRIRLLMWEALAAERQPGSARATRWQARVADIEAAQQSGRYPGDLDAAQLELTFAAIVLFPFAFPQLTRLITGRSPTDEAFVAARSAFLVALESRIVRKADAREAPKPRFRLAASVTESPPL